MLAKELAMDLRIWNFFRESFYLKKRRPDEDWQWPTTRILCKWIKRRRDEGQRNTGTHGNSRGVNNLLVHVCVCRWNGTGRDDSWTPQHENSRTNSRWSDVDDDDDDHYAHARHLWRSLSLLPFWFVQCRPSPARTRGIGSTPDRKEWGYSWDVVHFAARASQSNNVRESRTD